MRALIVLPLVVLAAAVAAVPANAAVEQRAITSVASLESSVLAEVNALRRAHGLVPLRLSRPLAAAAAAHSRAMGTHGFFAHESVDGTAFWRRVERYYTSKPYRQWSVGENLLFALPGLDGKSALRMWLASPPHRRNLLAPQWREIGLSVVQVDGAPGDFAGEDVVLVTADFGVRR